MSTCMTFIKGKCMGYISSINISILIREIIYMLVSYLVSSLVSYLSSLSLNSMALANWSHPITEWIYAKRMTKI